MPKSKVEIDKRWCKDHGVNLQVVCESCKRNQRDEMLLDPEGFRSLDHEGKPRRELEIVRGALTEWVAGNGLSQYLYEYRCPSGHRTYAPGNGKNTGAHFKRTAAKDGSERELANAWKPQ